MTATATPSIHAAFIAAYEQIENPKKNATNPAFRSSYATLEEVLAQVKPVLAEHNLAIIQQAVSDENGVGVHTYIVNEAGATLDFGTITLPLAKHDPQGAGSALTYARRYALKSVFGLAEVDDDGNEASKPQPKRETAAKPKAEGEATGWASVLESIAKHNTEAAVFDAIEAKYGKRPPDRKAAKAGFEKMTKAEQASLALIAVGAATS